MSDAQIMLHGVFLEIFDKGVLLTGASGAGKSDCALQLLDRKHRLIADDMVIFQKSDQHIIGRSPPALQNLLEIRGLGIVDIRKIFGTHVILAKKPLDLVIDITLPTNKNELLKRQVHPKLENIIIMDLSLLHLTLSLAFTGNMAILIESAVKFAFTDLRSKNKLVRCPE